MNFATFAHDLHRHFNDMCKGTNAMFLLDVDPDEMWGTYLNSFPEGTNPLYRVRTEHDCSCCRQFIKQVGALAVIKDGTVTNLWDFKTRDSGYQPIADAMNRFVRDAPIKAPFFTNQQKYGCKENYGTVVTATGDLERTVIYNHFYLDMPGYVMRKDPNSAISDAVSDFTTLKRALDEITPEAVMMVMELIDSNSLYRGAESKFVLKNFAFVLECYYTSVSNRDKELSVWEKSRNAGGSVCHIRNSSIGTLLVNLSEGMELDDAVTANERIVAPANYKRPKAIYTQRMLNNAKKEIAELGYLDSLPRRYANLQDITVNNILFVDRAVGKKAFGLQEGASFFDDMQKAVTVDPKKFSRADEVTIDDFISKVLPSAQGVEVFLENRHTKNMVSLIAPKIPDAKPMFKWNNPFSWAYTGNMADSALKANVEKAGGDVTGDLRFSIQWSDDPSQKDDNDLDAHCVYPYENYRYKQELYFGNKVASNHGKVVGRLDVDIIHPETQMKPAVENIVFYDRNTLVPGEYKFFVRCYNNRGGKTGFRAELECDGVIRSYDYTAPLKQDESVHVAMVTLDEDGNFKVHDILKSGVSSRDTWGLTCNQWHPVSVIMHSPNYWDGEKGMGAKHTFFMLKDCVNPEQPNPFFNEFLNDDFKNHRRVMEALGARASVEDTDNQLSGVGFAHTQSNYILVKVKGATERVLKVKF